MLQIHVTTLLHDPHLMRTYLIGSPNCNKHGLTDRPLIILPTRFFVFALLYIGGGRRKVLLQCRSALGRRARPEKLQCKFAMSYDLGTSGLLHCERRTNGRNFQNLNGQRIFFCLVTCSCLLAPAPCSNIAWSNHKLCHQYFGFCPLPIVIIQN